MSMFSGLTNQISGWVANKTGQGQQQQQGEEGMMDPQQMQENGGEGGEAMGGEQAPPQGGGGVSAMAHGLMMKAMTAKDGLKEKAGAFAPANLSGIGNNLISNVTNLIPGRKEEEVPTPPEPNPPSELMEGEQQYAE